MYYTISAVNNKGAHQTVWMRRLICAFAVRIWHRTNVLMKWLVFDMRTPIINKPLIKKFAIFNKSTKIKHIAAIRQMLHMMLMISCPRDRQMSFAIGLGFAEV